MFTLQGYSRSGLFQVTWDGGQLIGSGFEPDEIRAEAMHQKVGPPSGPLYSGEDLLADANAVFMLAYQLYEDVEIVAGMLPKIPDVPAGAIP